MACPRLTAAPRSSDVHTYNQQSLVVDEYRHVFAPAALVPARGARGRRKMQPRQDPDLLRREKHSAPPTGQRLSPEATK